MPAGKAPFFGAVGQRGPLSRPGGLPVRLPDSYKVNIESLRPYARNGLRIRSQAERRSFENRLRDGFRYYELANRKPILFLTTGEQRDEMRQFKKRAYALLLLPDDPCARANMIEAFDETNLRTKDRLQRLVGRANGLSLFSAMGTLKNAFDGPIPLERIVMQALRALDKIDLADAGIAEEQHEEIQGLKNCAGALSSNPNDPCARLALSEAVAGAKRQTMHTIQHLTLADGFSFYHAIAVLKTTKTGNAPLHQSVLRTFQDLADLKLREAIGKGSLMDPPLDKLVVDLLPVWDGITGLSATARASGSSGKVSRFSDWISGILKDLGFRPPPPSTIPGIVERISDWKKAQKPRNSAKK
jgi:hypothetical protein